MRALSCGLALALMMTVPAHAQHHAHQAEHAGHGEHTAAACTPEHAAMGHCSLAPDPSTDLPREPIPALTDTDRAAAFPALTTPHSHARALHWRARFNHLDAFEHGQAWAGDFWLGGDLHRLRMTTQGERRAGQLESATLSALYSRSVTPWWDVLLGARQDTQPDARTWASFGIEGLAPYFFELTTILHASNHGQIQFTLDAEYEVLLTNRLILQPELGFSWALKNQPHDGIGSGFGRMEAGLRLRYEITRRFAPYVGLAHERSLGHSADFARARQRHVRDTRVVAGVRVWF